MRKRSCSVAGCDKPQKGRGVCVMHLERLKRHGAVELPPRPKPVCSVEGCERPARARGLCNMHRCRVRLYGEPGEAAPRKGSGGTGTVHSRTGYRYRYRPDHPNAAKNGTVAEHILVMSQILGRPLRKGESVHHRNGVKLDNSPQNLELRTSVHPAGQSVLEMLDFCERYLAEYGPDREVLQASTPREEALS